MRDVPGVTRDRLYGQVAFERWQATVVDTGGFDPSSDEPLIEARAPPGADRAVDEADSCLRGRRARGCDARSTPRSRRCSAAADDGRGGRQQGGRRGGRKRQLADLYRLGFGEPVPVSAEHGRGVAEMLEIVRERAPRDRGA